MHTGMPRKTNWASAKTPPRRQRQQRQTTQLGELDTTPTRPDASPSSPTKRETQNGGNNQSVHGDIVDSEGFEDGIEDGDLVQLADTQAIPPNASVAKGFSWSETGSGARRSSSVSSNGGPSRSPFGYLGVGNVFSSPASGSDALPDTVPLTMDLMHDPLLGDQRQAPVTVDFSETATTVLRSSPMTGSRLSKSLGTSSHREFVDRVWLDASVSQAPPQPALVSNNKLIAFEIDKPIQAAKGKSGNHFISVDSTKAADIDFDGVRSAAKRSDSHRRADINLTTHFVSLDGAADRLDHVDGAALETTHASGVGKKQNRKRKQRPKSPLQFDNDTQVVKDVFKKPARKRVRQKPAQKAVKPSPLENLIQQVEVAKPSHLNASVAPGSIYHSPPVEMEANMHGDALENSIQHSPKGTEDSTHGTPADLSFNPQGEDAVDLSEQFETENHSESPTSSGVNTQTSENSSPRTPPTISTDNKDDVIKMHVPVTAGTIRRENLTSSLQIGDRKQDEYSAQDYQTKAEARSPAQQHNVPPPNESAYVDALRVVHDQNSKNSSANNTVDSDELSLAAARPSRHISVTGQGSPIRISNCEENVANPLSAEVPAPAIRSGTGCLMRPVMSATQHESNRSNTTNNNHEPNFAVGLQIVSPTAVSRSVLEGHFGLRRSILSELKKEHVNCRIANGQAKTHVSEPADQGRQRLHELVDACMQHLDAKKECIIKIADTYTKAGNHCVEKIQSRFERERSAVTRLAKEDTNSFFRALYDGTKSVERNSVRRGRLTKQFKEAMSARAASYAHASSALDTLHHAVLTGDNACLASGP